MPGYGDNYYAGDYTGDNSDCAAPVRLGDAAHRAIDVLHAAEARRQACLECAEIAKIKAALADLLTGIDVHNQRMAGRTDIPVPRIEGPVVSRASSVLKGGA